MAVRKCVSALTPAERKRFVDGIVRLKKQPSQFTPRTASRYDDYVYAHLQSMYEVRIKDRNEMVTTDNLTFAVDAAGNPKMLSYAHSSPVFLPWHRAFLHRFEKDLQLVTGDSSLGIPYWDWANQHDPKDPKGPWTDDFMGGDGNGADGAVSGGSFARGAWHLTFLSNGVEYLTRSFAQLPGACSLPTPEDVIATLKMKEYDIYPYRKMDHMMMGGSHMSHGAKQSGKVPPLAAFRSVVEGQITLPPGGQAPACHLSWSMHNLVHEWVGGTMADRATSPNDPIFFVHHSNVDRLWSEWQTKYPGVANYVPQQPDPDYPCQAANDEMFFYDPNNSTTPPWAGYPSKPSEVISVNALGYSY